MPAEFTADATPGARSPQMDRPVMRRRVRKSALRRTARRRAPSRAGLPHTAGHRASVEMLPRSRVLVVRKNYQAVKRALDVALCLAAMPLLLPILAVCAIAVWLNDPGPVLFVQMRTGKAGRRFKMYKFRTMLKNAEVLKEQYAHLNELQWPDFKITNDPRVTRVGRFLRRTSLDELPQLFNVLKGDMSLVGPRPTSFSPSKYALWQMERLEVLPGVTGLWQIRGRSDLEFDDRLRLDIEYIENQSLRLDLSILWQTFSAVWRQQGAY